MSENIDWDLSIKQNKIISYFHLFSDKVSFSIENSGILTICKKKYTVMNFIDGHKY